MAESAYSKERGGLSLTEQFDEQIRIQEERLAVLERQFQRLGWGKLLLLGLTVLLLVFWYRGGFLPGLLAGAGLTAAVQAGLWIRHIRVHRERDACRRLIGINRRYLERIGGGWTSFDDTGEEFLSADHPYGADLDIVGATSLFQFLNCAGTPHGRRRFAEMLLEPDAGLKAIRRRQEAVAELSGEMAFGCAFQCRAASVGAGKEIDAFVEHLRKPFPHPPRWGALLLRMGPVCVSALFLLAFLLPLTPLQLPMLVLLAAQGVFWAAGLPRLYPHLNGASEAPYGLQGYSEVLDLLEQRQFRSALLTGIREELVGDTGSASRAMRELDSIVGWIQVRTNPIVYFLLNVLLLWDYQCILRLGRWRIRYGDRWEGWLEALGEFEALLSLAGLPNVCNVTCLPQILEQGVSLNAKGLGHPLLPNGERVCNNISVGGEIHIISGSNMSGKTTFLRTVGINLVLARAGGFVCGEEMECSIFRIATSMRIADDLKEGVSTFYAELKRIKTIIEASRQDALFFLIDEIFRGTNSADRLDGARTVLSALHGRGVTGMITTHDLELCRLEQSLPRVRNFSFSESYRENQILFDYRMRPGPSRTTNAKFLMRMVGILE